MEDNRIIIDSYKKGYIKLYQPYAVEDYIKDIETSNLLGNAKIIELNIVTCRLGYPSTPHFIDCFLTHLAKMDGHKKLIIRMGCISYFEWVCLNIIVLEGSFFGIKTKISSIDDVNNVKAIINDKLRSADIEMIVELNNLDKTIFRYGCENND